MNAFKRRLMTMRETVRGTIFFASAQIPMALLAIVAAAGVLAIIVLLLAPAAVAFRALYGH